jgi:hypothetical protein
VNSLIILTILGSFDIAAKLARLDGSRTTGG